MKIAAVVLILRVENNSKFVRGKKRAIESIERYVLGPCGAKRLPSGEYEMKIPYSTDEGLDKIVDELLRDIFLEADQRNCFSESEARSKAPIVSGEPRSVKIESPTCGKASHDGLS